MDTVLILHIPVLHQGYVDLLKSWADKAKVLCIIGDDIIEDFPLDKREIRRVEPNTMRCLVESLGLFKRVLVLDKAGLLNIKNTKAVMADETISRELKAKYFDKNNVAVEFTPVFLRWDEQTVKSQKPVEYDAKISAEDFDKNIMRQALELAGQSSDWFRQIGAVLVKDSQIIVSAYNQRMPSPQAAYAEGDPRNYIKPGADTYLRHVLHAEQAVIAEAARRGISTEGADLYTTTFPCPDCAAVIAYSGIRRCFFGGGYSSLDGEAILKNHGVKLILVELVAQTIK